MKKYFFLGHTPELSILELNAVLVGASPALLTNSIASATTDTPSQKLMDSLGGTTKIAHFSLNTSLETLAVDIASLILSQDTKVALISDYAKTMIPSDLAYNVKELLKPERNVRFPSFNLDSHSLVAISKQNITEVNILEDEEGILLALTDSVHDFEGWTQRDRHKPYRNIKRGMMPPKLARIMVNIATNGKSGLLVADPFCGTGTVAMEALLLGNDAFASDLMPDAVEGTQKNLRWLEGKYDTLGQYQTAVLDATKLDTLINNLDCIVTEPFMGELIEEKHGKLFQKGRPLKSYAVKNLIKGLDKLYLGSLKSWYKSLKKEGRVVMIFPEIHDRELVLAPDVIDTCEKLGYNCSQLATYAKPDAIIKRKILLLEKI